MMKKLVFLMFVVYSVTFSYLSIRRHKAFYSSFDLANMDQASWTTVFSNKPFSVSGIDEQVSRLQFHSDFILVLLSPFFLIWNDVGMLLILQSVVIGLGCIPVYLISKKVLKREWLAVVLSLVYLLNPGLQWTNMYDFHGVSMAMTFLLFMVYFALVKKWKWYVVFSVLAMLTKEQIPLLVSMIGGLTFLFKDKKVGLLTFVGGFLIFFLLVFVVMPPFSLSGRHWAWDWFSVADSSSSGGINLPNMADLSGKFWNKDTKQYYYMLLRPFGFLPVAGLFMMVVSAPDLLINLLSRQAQMKSIVMHYDSGVVVGVILSLVLAFWIFGTVLKWLNKKILKNRIKFLPELGLVLISCWLLLWSIKSNYYYGPLPTTPSVWKWMYEVTDDEIEFEKVLRQIPKHSSTASSSEVRPHLTHRLNAFNLPHGLESDYIAMSLTNRIVGDNKVKGFEKSLIEKLDSGDDYELIFQKGDYYLYKRINEE